VSANELIEEIQRLPDDQAKQVYDYLFSTEGELDRVLATFDRLPRKSRLTEEETLVLPRARSPRQ
jgi:hypothetical protein